MLFTGVFLANLLCGFYNCQYLRPPPLTSVSNYSVEPRMTGRVGRSYDAPPPIVSTTQGLVQGYFMGVFGRMVYAFEGIPYAESPTGDLRFRDPVPKRKWTGVRDAMKPSVECLQFSLPRFLRVLGQEDCLQLNVYTPQIPSGDYNPKYPVMIFIHGGSFILGRAADYGPSYFLQENVILVTINYRLGVLGFLSTGDEEGLGNWGLKDQALAIKWVHDNIANFGGDPSKITISGQSAGALQSPQEARQITQTFAKRLRCPVNDGSKAMLDCLRRMDPNFLVAGQNNLIQFFGFPFVLFAPVVEQNVTGAFISETTEEAYQNGHVAKIPYMCTNTAEEGEYILMVMKNALVMGHLIRNWAVRAPLLLDLRNVTDPQGAAMEIRDVYLRDVPMQYRTSIIHSNIKKYAQIGSDRYFTLGNRRALKMHAAVAPTYSYYFKFKSHVGIASFLFTDYKDWGASHGEDMTVLFNNTAFSVPITNGDKAYDVSRMLISLVANFVTHNVPYHTAPNGSLVETWKPIVDPDYPSFLEISDDGMKMIADPMHGTEELNVWSRLGIK